MSTNYYLRHLPKDQQIEELKAMIDSSKDGKNFKDILYKVEEMYSTPDEYCDSEPWGVLHIGKRSDGWKFQWCPNIIKKNCSYIDETGTYQAKYEYKYRYPLTKRGLTDFIMRPDILVINEHDEILDKKEFLEMAFNWCLDGMDSISYNSGYTWNYQKEQEPFKELGFRFKSNSQSDFESDGLRWSIFKDFG